MHTLDPGVAANVDGEVRHRAVSVGLAYRTEANPEAFVFVFCWVSFHERSLPCLELDMCLESCPKGSGALESQACS